MGKQKKRHRRRRRTGPGKVRHPASPGAKNAVFVSEYTITDEPILDRNFQKLPEDVQEQIQELHDLAKRSPRQAIPILEDLLEAYPHIPQVYNHLASAYANAGDTEKMNAVVLENYRRHPDYLFAKCNYAELCIQNAEFGKIPAIFSNNFDLKMLYPRRKVFHVSEVATFMGTVGFYFFKAGQHQTAQLCCDILRQVAPGHPLTRRLRRALHPPLLLRLLMKLAGKPEGR